MKNKLSVVFAACLLLFNFSCSSTKMSSDRLGQEGKIRHLVESKRFVFNATSVNPQRANILNTIPNGNRLRDLTPGYFLSVMNDSISAYLPYFGRAYSAPYSTTDNGINVNTKKFSYTSKPGKKGVYIIKIIVDNDKNTQSFLLNIGTSGYATLQVQSVYRDAISFYGNIEPVKGDIE